MVTWDDLAIELDEATKYLLRTEQLFYELAGIWQDLIEYCPLRKVL